MSTETNVLYLELVAAKAKQLAHDVKNGKLWPGDLSNGLSEIFETLRKVETDRGR
jgi:hypothetical protein